MTTEDLCFLPATSLADAIRRRELSPVEIVRAVLDRIDAVNPAVNAVCTVPGARALAEAPEREAEAGRGDIRGPLHGVPVSFKDTTETAGIRTTYGSRIFEHNVPSEDAIVVERARRAGAIVIGKTNTPEFACKGTTDNPLFGVTRNPWDPGRIAGGSSGGAAAAVATGLGPLAEGTDLAGYDPDPGQLLRCGRAQADDCARARLARGERLDRVLRALTPSRSLQSDRAPGRLRALRLPPRSVAGSEPDFSSARIRSQTSVSMTHYVLTPSTPRHRQSPAEKSQRLRYA